ncbi:MAG: TIGR02757 family protein [Campylobacterales bacterium]|nr:TIGR02757 family protein [Campylobacterales bacterium]
MDIKKLLDQEAASRNSFGELSYQRPDPLLVASRYQDESIALICALFAYGNAHTIVKFLDSLDFSLLEQSETAIKKSLSNHYYRFQKADDVIALFIALKRLKEIDSVENIFYEEYKKEHNVLEGLWNFITTLREVYPKSSYGYNFLIGKVPAKINQAGTYKRYLMYLRWMVRRDSIDLGLWSKIDKSDLIMPLDTHTFAVATKIGLLKRKSYDLKAALELTKKLKSFDANDPIKYDFALYRLGQEKMV